MQTELREQA
jgi:exonuclease VII large subunit